MFYNLPGWRWAKFVWWCALKKAAGLVSDCFIFELKLLILGEAMPEEMAGKRGWQNHKEAVDDYEGLWERQNGEIQCWDLSRSKVQEIWNVQYWLENLRCFRKFHPKNGLFANDSNRVSPLVPSLVWISVVSVAAPLVSELESDFLTDIGNSKWVYFYVGQFVVDIGFAKTAVSHAAQKGRGLRLQGSRSEKAGQQTGFQSSWIWEYPNKGFGWFWDIEERAPKNKKLLVSHLEVIIDSIDDSFLFKPPAVPKMDGNFNSEVGSPALSGKLGKEVAKVQARGVEKPGKDGKRWESNGRPDARMIQACRAINPMNLAGAVRTSTLKELMKLRRMELPARHR